MTPDDTHAICLVVVQAAISLHHSDHDIRKRSQTHPRGNTRYLLAVCGKLECVIERVGTDGDMEKAALKYKELDGKVDAFGVGTELDNALRVGLVSRWTRPLSVTPKPTQASRATRAAAGQ